MRGLPPQTVPQRLAERIDAGAFFRRNENGAGKRQLAAADHLLFDEVSLVEAQHDRDIPAAHFTHRLLGNAPLRVTVFRGEIDDMDEKVGRQRVLEGRAEAFDEAVGNVADESYRVGYDGIESMIEP